jgi:hypothetical protein
MDEISLRLTADESSRIGKMLCEQAAVEICKIHLMRRDPGASFLPPGKGADLRVRSNDGTETDIEVKGTEATGITWAQLKVSSQQSHDRLKAGMPIYRVTGIRSGRIALYVMKHGVDFEMVPEPRWSVRPAKPK